MAYGEWLYFSKKDAHLFRGSMSFLRRAVRELAHSQFKDSHGCEQRTLRYRIYRPFPWDPPEPEWKITIRCECPDPI